MLFTAPVPKMKATSAAYLCTATYLCKRSQLIAYLRGAASRGGVTPSGHAGNVRRHGTAKPRNRDGQARRKPVRVKIQRNLLPLINRVLGMVGSARAECHK